MPAATRGRPRQSASANSHVSSNQPPIRGPATSREHAPDSFDDDTGSDEQPVATESAFQSNMGADMPSSILAALERMRRNMELNFRTLHDEMEEQRKETDKRFEEQRKETDKRFEEQRTETNRLRTETDRRFDEQRSYTKGLFTALRTSAEQYNANRGATHIHSGIRPVGRYNEATGQVSLPDGFPTRVHQFLRLKTRSRWSVLVNLLRFYEIQSWPTWGLFSMWPDDESDTEELLAPPHSTMEDAVGFAPEIALQELAAVIGLDYDKIVINREDDEMVQKKRVIHRKRGRLEVSKQAAPEKMSRVEAQERTAAQLGQQRATQKPKSASESSGARVEWDARTPREEKPRVKDMRAHEQHRGDQIPTRNRTEAVPRRPQTESDQ